MQRKVLFTTLLLAIFGFTYANPPAEADGKKIFSARCQSCHAIQKPFVGPALAGLHERRDIDWIIKFVQSSQTLIKEGDKEANALFAKFNNIPMPDHKDLTEDDIKNIVEFIKAESSVKAEEAPFAKPVKERPNNTPLSFTSVSFFLPFTILIVLLVASILLLAKVKEYERTKIW